MPMYLWADFKIETFNIDIKQVHATFALPLQA